MIDSLKKIISSHNHRGSIISINHLYTLKEVLLEFSEKTNLNQFQKYILNNIYDLETPDEEFTAKSIIIIAVPRPAYAHVKFHWQSKTFLLKSLVNTNDDAEDAITITTRYLKDYLAPRQYHIANAQNLPLKRLAVNTGLAVYGRNNVTYVKGMGSFHTLVAYFTDIEYSKDNWHKVKQADICTHCTFCITSCPMGAIKNVRFLIDTEKCLSYYNEFPGVFPEWIPITAHNCIYDCLLCQLGCPMNKQYIHNVIGPIHFNEQETDNLLAGQPFDTFSLEMQKKIIILGMDRWLEAIPRNLKILFDNYQH